MSSNNQDHPIDYATSSRRALINELLEIGLCEDIDAALRAQNRRLNYFPSAKYPRQMREVE